MKNQDGSDAKINFLHGTTTLAFKYQGGIVIAVDSRATGGMYIFSGNVKKVKINVTYLLFRKDKNRIYFELVNQTLLTSRHLF